MERRFFTRRALAASVRYVYCGRCERVSTNVWRERDVCMYCGGHAELLPDRAPWHRYASGAILVAAAALLIFGPVTDDLGRDIIVVVAIVAGLAASSLSLSVTRARIARELRAKGIAVRGKA